MALAFFITQLKPGFGDIADALQFALHFLLLAFHDLRGGAGGDINWRGEENYGAGEGRGQEEMVPGIGEGLAAVDANVEHDDGHPVFRASMTGPGLAMYRGPRGPSMVKPQSRPCSRRRAIIANPRKPPRVELPCAVPKPSHSMTLRVHWPSNAVVLRMTMPRFLAHHTMGMMTRCQKAKMQRRRAE